MRIDYIEYFELSYVAVHYCFIVYLKVSSLIAASKLPLSITSVSPDCKAEADAGTCKSDPVYMNQICEKSFCDGISIFSCQ